MLSLGLLSSQLISKSFNGSYSRVDWLDNFDGLLPKTFLTENGLIDWLLSTVNQLG